MQLRELLLEYRDIFSIAEGDLGRTTVTTHKIDTSEACLIRQPLRRAVKQNGLQMANIFLVLLMFLATALMLEYYSWNNQDATSVARV